MHRRYIKEMFYSVSFICFLNIVWYFHIKLISLPLLSLQVKKNW
ncbi:hypothetical protein HMPREF9072_01227 [Capnocytophaga sp. oral taxon 324 str. F0483]|nr:hypothetical protein HMPREF9072_01227 [Capnocytophaga sp. oral taxon 324 str. F0483]